MSPLVRMRTLANNNAGWLCPGCNQPVQGFRPRVGEGFKGVDGCVRQDCACADGEVGGGAISFFEELSESDRLAKVRNGHLERLIYLIATAEGEAREYSELLQAAGGITFGMRLDDSNQFVLDVCSSFESMRKAYANKAEALRITARGLLSKQEGQSNG